MPEVEVCEAVREIENRLYRAIAEYRRLPPGWLLRDLTAFIHYTSARPGERMRKRRE